MWGDILLQAVLILTGTFMLLALYEIPQKFISKLRFRNRGSIQAKRHFVIGAQLLAQARSSESKSSASSLAKQAEAEADKAISFDYKDAAAHILKALALDLQGFKTSALESFDLALSIPAVKTLTEKEKGDALFKRAEVKMSMNRRAGRVDSAIDDLTEAVKIHDDNVKALCLLGECYEVKKMRDEARTAYESALKIEPSWTAAQAALDRLDETFINIAGCVFCATILTTILDAWTRRISSIPADFSNLF